MRYEGYSTQERVNDILDKISKYGILSITKLEKEFLDAHKSGEEEEIHNKITKEESETIFEDDNNLFRFEFESEETFNGETHYIGTIYVPDLILSNGKKIKGRLSGRIIAYKNGTNSPEFYSSLKDSMTHENYEIFDFCNGIEYELDNFIDYVISELNEK
jgi:hypothetical protein